jgi:hypothetical protein
MSGDEYDPDAYSITLEENLEAAGAEVRRLEGVIREKDAEIERLKEENAHFAWRDKDKNRLIIELCDALDGPRFDAIHQRELVQRAQEAT